MLSTNNFSTLNNKLSTTHLVLLDVHSNYTGNTTTIFHSKFAHLMQNYWMDGTQGCTLYTRYRHDIHTMYMMYILYLREEATSALLPVSMNFRGFDVEIVSNQSENNILILCLYCIGGIM